MKVHIENLNMWYGDNLALRDINMNIQDKKITAFIGPSGCGKSSLLRCLNRMNDLIDVARIEGSIRIDGVDVYGDIDPVLVRRQVGMVFQSPNPFPKSIYKNITWGARINGFQGNEDELVERVLKQAALWDEVKDRLDTNAYDLSGGQQQRLCIARALAVEPQILLMDEPTSALDPIASSRVEETIAQLASLYTIVIVTHNMQQAQRISDETAFFYRGDLIEMRPTAQLFEDPREEKTNAYLSGEFG